MTATGQTYSALYPDGHNEKVTLGKLLNKGGPAGKIYADATHENSVAKIFHNKEHSDTNRKKLEAMLQNRPNIPTIPYEGKEYIQIAWPTALLEDEKGFCVGYLMPLIDTKEAISLDHIIQKAVRRKLGLSEPYVDRVFAAYNITSVVAALHACGHYIVDLKPTNVSIYKNTMLVAMFDCDGFSIKGENDARYPAEYGSEEYIYPEGMQQTCQQMGEEQDKFALAVIIFKLLNEGIHPFSGAPRKNENMLSIQERIADYHYAYGIWPDTYQAPHPYSIHDYFDKNTMNMFERAFTKGNERPSALEWQMQLEYILKHLKQCKKNPDHAYFTPKGCGLCMIAEKFKVNVDNYKKQQETEKETLRGVKIKELTIENLQKINLKNIKNAKQAQYGSYLFIGIYILFFASLFKLVAPFKQQLQDAGIFVRLLLLFVCTTAVSSSIKSLPKIIPLKNQNLFSMLYIFALACLVIAFLSISDLPYEIFRPIP